MLNILWIALKEAKNKNFNEKLFYSLLIPSYSSLAVASNLIKKFSSHVRLCSCLKLLFYYIFIIIRVSWSSLEGDICYVYIATCNKKFIEPFFSFLLTLISSHNFTFLSTCLSNDVILFFSAQSVYDNKMTCKRENLLFFWGNFVWAQKKVFMGKLLVIFVVIN